MITIPEGLKGKELFDWLIANKSALVKQKKSVVKRTESIIASPERLFINKDGKLKQLGDTIVQITSDDEFPVKVVANACNWCDTDMDVLVRDSSKKTIQQRKTIIPHIHDHIHEVASILGDVQDIYLEDVALRKLGLNASGATQCIIFETLLKKSYNPRVFDLYKAGKINQHSIGLLYVRLELAINMPEYEKEMDFWNKYYPDIINKDVVDEAGYFWVVQEIKLLENSCVLFGANELTPTLEAGGKSHSDGTAGKASQKNRQENAFDLNVAIKQTKFF